MNKLNIKLQHCYGIKKLEKKFVFSNRTFAIYAPNGSMKTSFAKTFRDLMNNEQTKDLVYPERTTIREIKDENNSDIPPEEVFIIEPYNERYFSDKESTLVVEKELREKYEKIDLFGNNSPDTPLPSFNTFYLRSQMIIPKSGTNFHKNII